MGARSLHSPTRRASLLLLLCAPLHSLDVYPSPGAGTAASADYSALVGPSSLPAFVYFTSRAAMQPVAPNNNIPQPSGRNTSFFGFAMGADDGPVTVVVTVSDYAGLGLSSAQIVPLSAAAAMPPPAVSGRTVTLRVDQPRQFCLVVDGVTDAPLCVFADPPETYTPSPTDPGVIFFAAGTTDAGVINVTSGQTVYLAPGAHVFGRVQLVSDSSACSEAGRGVAVRGRGVLDGHRFTIDGEGPSLVELPCTHALLEGVTMIDSPKYNFDGGWPYTVVRWAKAVAWAFSTDGVDLGSQGLLEHSFLKVNDDSIKPFGPGGLARSVVVWQQENGCAVMGSWNLNQASGFVTVRDVDVIRHERTFGGYYPDALLCFMHGGSGVLSSYLFDDIRVDSAGFALANFFITPNPWASPTGGVIGNVSTVIVRNVVSAHPFLAPQAVLLEGNSTLSGVRSVTFDSVTIGGRPATSADVGVVGSPAFVDAPTFCVNCTAGVVGEDWTAAQKCSLPDSWCSSAAAAAAASASSAPPDLCVDDALGFVTAIAAPCPAGTSAIRGVGANLFDVFWGAWGTGGDNANLATSLQAVRDAGASGVRVGRAFAAPWAYAGWAYLSANASERAAYWAAADAVIAEAERANVKIVPSLGHGCADSDEGCNPAVALFNETYREFVVNASSRTRTALRAYATDFVTRYKHSPAVLFWEVGNEMNLMFDGCTYDKSDGAFFTTAEGLAYLAAAAADIRAADPLRPVNTGIASPRSRAKHLMNTPGGGRACVSPANPHGDCESACWASVGADSQADSAEMFTLYTEGHDLATAHYYGCAPPYGNYSWCAGDDGSSLPLAVFKAAADAAGKPFFVGEFGDPALNWSAPTGRALVAAMAELSIPLSTLWAWECPSHDHVDMGGGCLHPGDPEAQPWTAEVLALSQQVSRQLYGRPPRQYNMSQVFWLPEPTGAPNEPACLDGSRYGYYGFAGAENKWLVMLQGGGWCFNLDDCFARTQPAYAGGGLGSSKYWPGWTWAWDFGPDFADWGVLYLPYCDGGGYAGHLDSPAPFNSSLNLFFRGAANLRAALADAVARFGIAAPAEVVVTGGSAGGLSTTLHVDLIGSLLGAQRVAGVPQCGFFPFYDAPCFGPEHSAGEMCNATGCFRALAALMNTTGALSPACVAAQPGGAADAWRCFMASEATPHVAAPLFIWQSKFDHFDLEALLSVDCAFDQAYTPPWNAAPVCSRNNSVAIRNFGELLMQQLLPAASAPGPARALFLTSCVLHGMDYHFLTVGDSANGELGTSPDVAFNLWYRAVVDPDHAPVLANDWKWVEDLPMPRTDNPLACPPFVFSS